MLENKGPQAFDPTIGCEEAIAEEIFTEDWGTRTDLEL
jgi:hypothetical protein